MGRVRAVFLDRDGTLSRMSDGRLDALRRAFARVIGKGRPAVSWSDCMGAFQRLHGRPPFENVDTLEREHAFWRAVYEAVLRSAGAEGDLVQAAAKLYEDHPFYRMMEPYEETMQVLAGLRGRGYRLGVISDTFPSLRLTLEMMGIADAFESFTASSLVGACKPDPKIFRAATADLGVGPAESAFVDDTLVEADGARTLGFTAFHLDRTLAAPDFAHWRLGSLWDLLTYLDAQA